MAGKALQGAVTEFACLTACTDSISCSAALDILSDQDRQVFLCDTPALLCFGCVDTSPAEHASSAVSREL